MSETEDQRPPEPTDAEDQELVADDDAPGRHDERPGYGVTDKFPVPSPPLKTRSWFA